MLEPDQARAASDLLFEHWQNGRRLAALPRRLMPATRAEGYRVQSHLEERSAAPLFGWKIAATSAAGQAHINVDGPMAGRILAERVLRPGATVSLANNHMRVAELEFAFRMGTTLPPRPARYEVDEVLAAVETLHPAIEIPDSRFQDFTAVGAAQLIADNACAHLFMLGDSTEAHWRNVDLAAHKVIACVPGKSECHGHGSNVLEHPLLALTWLVNELSQHGTALHAGQVVTTGTCTVPVTVEPGDEVLADFGTIGQLSIRFR